MSHPLTKHEQELKDQFEDNRVQFLMTELDTSTTFCEIALSAEDRIKVERNIKNAVTGYQTAMRLAEKAQLDVRSTAEFEQKVKVLRGKLKALGQSV